MRTLTMAAEAVSGAAGWRGVMALVEPLGWTLVHFAWQGVLIGVFAAVALRVLRGMRPQVRYAVACAALLLMVVTPVITFVMVADQERRGGGVLTTVSRDGQHVAATGSVVGTIDWPAFRAMASGARSSSPRSSVAASSSIAASPSASSSSAASSVARPPLPLMVFTQVATGLLTIQRVLPWVVSIWCLGVLLLLARLVGGLLLLDRLAHTTRPAAEDWQRRVVSLAQRLHLHRRITIRESLSTHSPAVIGWLRPVILLPASVLAGLSPTQVEAILVHELAHIRRHDYIVNLLQSVAETLLFYHPAVWFISRQIRTEREHCCDDVAVDVCGDAVAYVEALADLERLRGSMPAPALAATGGPLLQRVQRLLAPAPQRPFSWSAASALILGLIAIGFVTGIQGDEQRHAPSSTPRASAAGRPVVADRSAVDAADDDDLDAIFRAQRPLVPAPPEVPAAPAPAPEPVAAPSVEAWPVPPAPPAPAPAIAGSPRAPRPTPVVAPAPEAPAMPLAAPEPPEPPQRMASAAPMAPIAPMAAIAGQRDLHPVPPAPAAPARPPVAAAVAAPPSPPVMSQTPVAAPSVPPAPPAPPAPPSASSSSLLGWLWGENLSRTSYSLSDKDGRKLAVLTRGSIELTDDDSDVKEIEDGGYLKVEERSLGSRRRVEIRSTGGTLQRRWLKNGSEAEYDNDAKQWLSRTLKELGQRTGLGAEKRIARILTQRGPAGLVDAVAPLQSDYVKRLYLQGALSSPALDTPTMVRTIEQAGLLSSNYERCEVLLAAAKRGFPTDDVRLAYVKATLTMSSGYEHKRALHALLDERLSSPVVTALLTSAAKIESDYELAEVLKKVAETQTLDATSSAQFIAATGTMESDYEHRRSLMPYASRHGLSAELQQAVLTSAKSLDSDYETAELLIAMVKAGTIADAARPAFFTVVDTLQSDYERGRALKAYAEAGKPLSDASVRDVITATSPMHSDYETANVLTQLASSQAIAGNARDAFVKAAERMQSKYERDRALVALVRQETPGGR